MSPVRGLIFCCALLLGAAPALAIDQPPLQPLTLSGYSAHMPDSWLSPAERAWLAQRGPLRVGVAQVDRPPLQIVGGGRLEGVSADYLGLLAGGYQRVYAYPSREAALEALRKGEIDLVCGGTASEAEARGLLLSRAYLQDQPVLVSDDARPFDASRPSRQRSAEAVARPRVSRPAGIVAVTRHRRAARLGHRLRSSASSQRTICSLTCLGASSGAKWPASSINRQL